MQIQDPEKCIRGSRMNVYLDLVRLGDYIIFEAVNSGSNLFGKTIPTGFILNLFRFETNVLEKPEKFVIPVTIPVSRPEIAF